jgi:hypothetical protein
LYGDKHRDIFLKSKKDFGVLRSCWPYNAGVKLANYEKQKDFYYHICQQDLHSLEKLCDKILILHPTDQSKVWWYQNFCEKVTFSQDVIDSIMPQLKRRYDNMSWLTTKDPVLRARHQLDLQKQQSGLTELFELYKKTSAIDFDTWQLRNALAVDLRNQTTDVFQCWSHLNQEFNNIKFVSIHDLRDNFQRTIIEILNFFDIEPIADTDLCLVETEWKKQQKHQFKDELISTIVEAIVNNRPSTWTNQINFFDEVYIQKILNDQGITLLEIDDWPTTTQEFNKIIR